MRLDDGWNQIQFNLSDFTCRAYDTNYIETLRVQVSSDDARLSRSGQWCTVFCLRFIPTVVSGVCISLTDCILKMSCQQSSSCISLSRTRCKQK